MNSPFKQAYVPYACFLVGVLLIFLWARSRSVEGFENNGLSSTYVTKAPYSFEMYYVDWCPHCHSALPEFKALTGESKDSTVTIGGKQVACKAIEAEKNPDQVRGKVSGYPTIQLYNAEGSLVKEYSGQRTQAGFLSFLEDAVNRPQ